MGLRDLPFWGRMVAEVADAGLNQMGAQRCATRGHKWRDARTVVLTDDGSAYEAPRGTMQRCRRCGITRPNPDAPTA
ncbi:MAG TPA: hypothetical protein VF818_05710 [Ktedonobacterales bacterium]